jgi:hypothetical protein
VRRILSGVMGAALLLSMIPVAAGAAAPAPFSGTWTSIDVFDGSTQYLSIDNSARPTVTLVDLYASYCANHGALSTLYVGSGTGKFKSSTELDVTMRSAACGSFKVPLNHSNAGIKFTLQTDGTLLDTYRDIWHLYP